MDQTPFPHYGPLQPDEVTQRDVEANELATLLRDRRHDGGGLRIVDPLLADWLRRTFPY